MITGNTHNKFNDDKTCGSEDMIADRLKTFFSANPSHCSLSFSSSELTTLFPRLIRLLLAQAGFTF